MDNGIHTAVALKYLQIMSVRNAMNLPLKLACVVLQCAYAAVPPGITYLLL